MHVALILRAKAGEAEEPGLKEPSLVEEQGLEEEKLEEMSPK